MISAIDYSKKILERFAAFQRNDRLAHAYLFAGPVSVGKSETAIAIAKLVNCLDPQNGMFCDECSSCVKINNGQHPDIHIVDTMDTDSIKIASIREIIRQVNLRPFEAKKKIFIVKNSENLTLDAANSLLKTLEEPSQNSLIILTSSFPERNLRTIVSRCHMIKFTPLNDDELFSQIKNENRLADNSARFISRYSQGCLGRARRYISEKLQNEKNMVIDSFVYVAGADAYTKKLLGEKERLQEAMDILLSWFRDLILVKSGVDEKGIINTDRIKDITMLVKKYSFDELNDIIEGIVTTKESQDNNFNTKVAVSLLKEKIWRK